MDDPPQPPAPPQRPPPPQRPAPRGRSMVGSLLGAALAFGGWFLLDVHEFLPRLLIAFVGFGIGHGIVALARRLGAGSTQ